MPLSSTPPMNLSEKLIRAHLIDGNMSAGEVVALKADQVLLQDATGTLTMLALNAIGLDRIRVPIAAQYIDHLLFQADSRNPDDHIFLDTAARRFGIWLGRPGTGISHPVHMEAFGVPGQMLVGADSHTCAAGALGMLAIGAGSIDVAAVLAGEPFDVPMPHIMGVRLTGSLPDWVSAKDVILEMLRRHGVKGGVGKIIEYYGPGLAALTAMDRHVIANMGAELGATTSIFPADEQTREFLSSCNRECHWRDFHADPGATYDLDDEIDLSKLEPLIATPSSPDNVVPVRQAAGAPIYQAYIGSSANPGFRDFAIAALMVRGREVAPGVSFDINPSTRSVLLDLMRENLLTDMIQAGGRLHQAGCNGCMGMGQAPATGRNSLRTVPRNFPGRSGTKEDSVFLCSPETATASALTGKITDPRDLGIAYPEVSAPLERAKPGLGLVAPVEDEKARATTIAKGPSISDLPEIEPLEDALELPVFIKVGDNVSTDAICPAGAEAMPYRSNIQKISQFCFKDVDPGYVERSMRHLPAGHAYVAGDNYGQGSSREHAVLAPRYLGLRLVIAKSFARIQLQNLINAGVLALTFADANDYDQIDQNATFVLQDIRDSVRHGRMISLAIQGQQGQIGAHAKMTPRQIDIFLAGGLVNYLRPRTRVALSPSTELTG